MNYYTGMSSQHFLSLLALLNAGDICSRLRYWGSNNSSIKGQKHSLEPKDELFLTLAHLQDNIPKKVLADNYKISAAEISRIFVSWLDLIYSRLVQLLIWASKNIHQITMPECFGEKCPLTRVIIDCMKIFIQKPSCLRPQSGEYCSSKP